MFSWSGGSESSHPALVKHPFFPFWKLSSYSHTCWRRKLRHFSSLNPAATKATFLRREKTLLNGKHASNSPLERKHVDTLREPENKRGTGIFLLCLGGRVQTLAMYKLRGESSSKVQMTTWQVETLPYFPQTHKTESRSWRVRPTRWHFNRLTGSTGQDLLKSAKDSTSLPCQKRNVDCCEHNSSSVPALKKGNFILAEPNKSCQKVASPLDKICHIFLFFNLKRLKKRI